MRLLLRILFLIPIAYIAACISAAFILLLAMGEQNLAESGSDFLAKALAVSIVGAPFVGTVAALPALVVIVLAETLGWRSLLIHLVLGLAIGLIALVLLGRGGPDLFTNGGAGASAGAVGGFVYWLIAGRTAGRSRAEREPAPVA